MSEDIDPVLGAQRQRDLLSYIRASGLSHVNELTRETGVSPSTVRRDLADLERRGLVERVRGGAQAVTPEEPIRPLREVANSEEKRRIGRAAAKLVPPGASILINGGTTTEAMLPFLDGIPGLTVITNSITVTARLAHLRDVEIVTLGGVLRRAEMSLLGHLTLANLADFEVDLVFSSAFGVDPDAGVTGINVGETQTDRALVSAARLILLVDRTKFAQRGTVRLVPYEGIDTVVTDGPLDPELRGRLADRGPDLVVA